MDLTPRTSEVNAPLAPRKRKAKWGYVAVLVVIVVAGGTIVTKFLTSAIDYYCNVDEIGSRDGCEPGRRIRVQGTVETGSLKSVNNSTNFVMIFNEKTIQVCMRVTRAAFFRSAYRLLRKVGWLVKFSRQHVLK